ncbi:hypothetical protein FF962_31560 [Pseudomonas aeruginosa]|uniref:hypothetical protein n=1 Tax=Pseudomonas aeruginosa TaxID=287 RepID=UPI001198308D|nr:hypothetical protein [Pseudomonas aeruginosa]QDY05379.1 hypothetical protein FF962_31560 [Pseudomonas aeruginosa]
MDTSKLKKFAQYARRTLLDQVSGKLDVVLAPQSAARRERAQVVAELEKLKWTHRSRQFFSEFKLRRLLPLQLVGAAP